MLRLQFGIRCSVERRFSSINLGVSGSIRGIGIQSFHNSLTNMYRKNSVVGLDTSKGRIEQVEDIKMEVDLFSRIDLLKISIVDPSLMVFSSIFSIMLSLLC